MTGKDGFITSGDWNLGASHLLARKDGVLCAVCLEIEPVYCGDGTPVSSLVEGYRVVARRHPRNKHGGALKALGKLPDRVL